MDIYFLNYILSHIVLKGGQWSVGFILDSNHLTSTGDFQQRALNQLKEERRDQIEQVEKKTRTLSFIHKLKETKHRYQPCQEIQQTEHPQKDMELKVQQLEETEKKSQLLQHLLEVKEEFQQQKSPNQIETVF